MKYAVVILGGAADEPIGELDGMTPLETAETPNIDGIALAGRVGVIAATPPNLPADADVGALSILGFDPERTYFGRAPIEAAAIGVDARPDDWACCVTLLSLDESVEASEEGVVLGPAHEALSAAESGVLFDALLAAWAEHAPDLCSSWSVARTRPGAGVIIDSAQRLSASIAAQAPHAVTGKAWIKHAPKGDGADRIVDLMRVGRAALAEHEVNLARRSAGLSALTLPWMWGVGKPRAAPSFEDLYALRAGIVCGHSAVAGVARLAGVERVPPEGAADEMETNLRAAGAAAAAALDDFDVVVVHAAGPGDAARRGDFVGKIEALQRIDSDVVGPLYERLTAIAEPMADDEPGWRMLICVDHRSLCRTRGHDGRPTPFAMAGAWVRSLVERRFSEAEAEQSDLHVDPGFELMEYFLFSGVKGARPKPDQSAERSP